MPSRGPPPPENPFVVALKWTGLDDIVYYIPMYNIILCYVRMRGASDLRSRRRRRRYIITKNGEKKITTTTVVYAQC